ncbi:preprotein translocase subunit SecG [Chachezhania sediminis]|uniref:preprotein translocase subunit SecG n=1 Tax=Chachezhania sediminis TaxID=2599291 RepID=UPI00131D46A7|nr:preprotein translocase subunit SecG [Chachezhania sediminis]
MENVVLIVHLLLALGLVGVVLLQRSEGGGLGMGSGGGGGGVMTGRAAATALGKVTWGLAIAFLCTSLTLTILAAEKASQGSVMDVIGPEDPTPFEAPAVPGLPSGSDLLPPTPENTGSSVPRAD